MKYLKIGLGVVAVAWFSLIGGYLFWNFAPSSNFLGVTTRASSAAGGHQQGTIGKRRYLMLVEATRVYREGNEDVSPGVAEGREFAPVPFLNSELKRLGARWRVRSADGLDVKIYEIS